MTDRAAELRAAFDRAFADPIAASAAAPVELLLVEIAGLPYAIPQAEIAAVHVDLPLVAVPALTAALLGIAAVRNQLLPVYDLGALLGHRAGTGATGAASRWLVVARTADPAGVGLAFDRFIGHLRVASAPAGGVVRTAERAHTVIDVQAVVAAITRLIQEQEH